LLTGSSVLLAIIALITSAITRQQARAADSSAFLAAIKLYDTVRDQIKNSEHESMQSVLYDASIAMQTSAFPEHSMSEDEKEEYRLKNSQSRLFYAWSRIGVSAQTNGSLRTALLAQWADVILRTWLLYYEKIRFESSERGQGDTPSIWAGNFEILARKALLFYRAQMFQNSGSLPSACALLRARLSRKDQPFGIRLTYRISTDSKFEEEVIIHLPRKADWEGLRLQLQEEAITKLNDVLVDF